MSDGKITDVDERGPIHVGYVVGVKSQFYDVHTKEKSFSICNLCRGVVEWDDPLESHACPPVGLIALRDRAERGF